MNVLGVNAVFHDPAAALVVDGVTVAAAEEERFSRRKHGKDPVPFSTWELPVQAARWCLEEAGITAADLDAIAYSYDPALALPVNGDITADEWEPLRTLYAQRAGRFLAAALPGADPAMLRHVAHHVAHAASAHLASPFDESAVMVLDGRGESGSYLGGHYRGARLEVLAQQALPSSLGLMYEELTAHLGFRRSSDEYKVMALASYGRPDMAPAIRDRVHARPDGGFDAWPIEWQRIAPAPNGGGLARVHADLASSAQRVLEEVTCDLAQWLHDATGCAALTMAGGVALNCVANSALLENGPFDHIWVQPAAGDSGTALGAALHVASEVDEVRPMATPALGRWFSDAEVEEVLTTARVPYERPADIAAATAAVLAAGGVVGWFQGRSEFGPRALGRRSLLANPADRAMTARLNDVKGREQFRPIAPMILEHRAAEVLEGPLPSPHMLFVQRVRAEWRDRIPAVVHVDGTARAQTVHPDALPDVAALLTAFEQRTGLPVLVNTSFNTAGRPMVDTPHDALECFGASPIDALAMGPFLVRR